MVGGGGGGGGGGYLTVFWFCFLFLPLTCWRNWITFPVK